MENIKYDPAEDYIAAHLAFINKHPNYKRVDFYPNTYREIMENIWAKNRPNNNELAFKWFLGDLYSINKHEEIINNLEKQFKDNIANNTVDKYFVTINFHEDSFKSETALEMLDSLSQKDFIKSISGVFEYYTETGHHPHFMCKLETKGKVTKGRLAQKIYQTKNIKKLIQGPNFIQVMKYLSQHDRYLELDKSTEKMENVIKDIDWRKKMKLPEIYQNKNI